MRLLSLSIIACLGLLIGCSSERPTEAAAPIITVLQDFPEDNAVAAKVYTVESPEPCTMIDFYLPAAGHARIDVYSGTGYHIKNIFNDVTSSGGTYFADWCGVNEEGQQVVEGEYFLVITYGELRNVATLFICYIDCT